MKALRKSRFYPWIVAVCLIAFAAWAANPSFSDFNGGQFTTAGNVVTINHLNAGLLDSGTIGTSVFPALSGVITTPGGSFSTSFGSFSSATLAGAITDETGSGAAVFANGPTFAGQPVFGGQTATTILGLNGGKGLVSVALSGATFDGTTFTVTGGGGVTGGSNTLVSGSTVNLNNSMTNINSITFNNGSSITNVTGSTNSFEVDNSGGNKVFGVTSNGIVTAGTNVQFKLDTSGNETIAGNLNAVGENISGATASTFASFDGSKNIVSTINGATLTNLTYQYTTNRNGATTLTFGTAYWTNIAANLTISALTIANPAFYESGVLWVTNSSASDRTITWPSGVIGPVGTGTPSVMTATNKTITRFIYEHFGPNEITVTKTDFGP